MKQLLSSLLLLGVLFSACEKGLDGEIVVEPKFQPFVDRFVEEAARRGKDIDFSDTGLSFVFRDAVDRESGGVCRGNHQIEIEKFYWEDLSEIYRKVQGRQQNFFPVIQSGVLVGVIDMENIQEFMMIQAGLDYWLIR